jgi:dTDP-glucose pyrophosphorylase
MSDIALVMPMAGRGSRFAAIGIKEPKPLIDLKGRPFFWWATESVRRTVPIREMVFVVLAEHCDQFNIDKRIAEFYPDAQIVMIPDVTSGAAESAQIGLAAVSSKGPVAINDCDHAFISHDLAGAAASLMTSASGALLCFRSESPAYSYVKLGPSGEIVGTVEKKVASQYAIAGCYLFSSSAVFGDLYDAYRSTCTYSELFVSGLYDLLAAHGGQVLKLEAEQHCSFGTPEELSVIADAEFHRFLVWKDSA